MGVLLAGRTDWGTAFDFASEGNGRRRRSWCRTPPPPQVLPLARQAYIQGGIDGVRDVEILVPVDVPQTILGNDVVLQAHRGAALYDILRFDLRLDSRKRQAQGGVTPREPRGWTCASIPTGPKPRPGRFRRRPLFFLPLVSHPGPEGHFVVGHIRQETRGVEGPRSC